MRVYSRVLSVLAVSAAIAAAPVPIALASGHGGHGGDERPTASPSASAEPGEDADEHGVEAGDDSRRAAAGDDDGMDDSGAGDAPPADAMQNTAGAKPARPRHVDVRPSAFDRAVVSWQTRGADPVAFVVRLESKTGIKRLRVDGDDRTAEFTGLAADTRWRAEVDAVAADGTKVESADADALRTPTADAAVTATARAAKKAAAVAERAARRADSARHRAHEASGDDAVVEGHAAGRADKVAKRAAKLARAAAREASRAKKHHHESEPEH